MMEKLYEYDPKLGHGCYNRVWFVDFSTLDIDEESKALAPKLHSYVKIQYQLIESHIFSTDYLGILWQKSEDK